MTQCICIEFAQLLKFQHCICIILLNNHLTMANHVNFKTMSFNVRGLREEKKRASIFRFIRRKKADIVFIQEAHSKIIDETNWKNEWGGNLLFNHGAYNARGVLTLIKPNLDFKLVNLDLDQNGRLQIINCYIQNSPFKLINIYAPNTITARVNFFKEVKRQIFRQRDDVFSKNLIMGGDFNTILNQRLGRKGGTTLFPPKYKDTVKLLEDIQEEFDVLDVWRIKNPDKKRFTWRQHNPQISSRLDYWLISRSLFDSVDETDIIPSIKSDHSPITMTIKSSQNEIGKGLWKMNNSFIDEEKYVGDIKNLINDLKNDNNLGFDKVVFWEYLKYKIRKMSIEYGKSKAKERRDREMEKESRLKIVEEELDKCDNERQKRELLDRKANLKTELQLIDDYKTEGLILRSKCEWHEKGEKSNSYFLRLCSKNKVKTSMNKLLKVDGKETCNQKEITKMQKAYYESLYSKRKTKNTKEKEAYLNNVSMKTLSEEAKTKCEGKLSLEELDKSIKSFKKNKSPGNDGITCEFYLKFWSLLKKPLLDCLNEGYNNGYLSTSQQQAVITLLDKGKDRLLLKNWRPISLLNVDYKIGTKALAERLKKQLPNIINENQVGYVQGRKIIDNIRTIEDIYHYTNTKKMSGILINIDFEKAFDSVDWEFLKLTLIKFNFGQSFINWVEAIYRNAKSCVINNGNTTEYFKVSRGVRQGDPLSPYLFLLVVEVLSSVIRQNKKIKGIIIGGKEIKILQYADDTSGLLADETSGREFLKTVQIFGAYSGLILNKDKTEAAWLGAEKNNKSCPFGISWPKEPLRVLGVFVSYDINKNEDLNFNARLKKCRNILNQWKARNLTLFGKAQVIKTFIISQFLYTTSAIHMPEKFIKELEDLMFDFIWSGRKPKLKRSLIKQTLLNGGLGVPDIKHMIMTNRINWLKDYKYGNNQFWKNTFRTLLNECGIQLDVLLMSDFSMKFLKSKTEKKVPTFYIEILRSWKEIGNQEKKKYFLWYNKNIKVNNTPVFYSTFHSKGINFVSDLIDEEGSIIEFENIKNGKDLNKKKWFQWYGLVQAIKKNNTHEHKITKDILNNTLMVNNIGLEKIKTKGIYKDFMKLENIEQNKLRCEKYVPLNQIDNVHTTYIKCYANITDIHTRAFQYKFLNDILINNYWLSKWKIKNDTNCTFCGIMEENMLHLFWQCKYVKSFWDKFQIWVNQFKIYTLSQYSIFYGENDRLLCTLLLMAKKTIYYDRHQNNKPNFQHFKNIIRSIRKKELNVAITEGRIDSYAEKWEPLSGFK